MATKPIICHHCSRFIEDRHDLVTAWVLFSVVPYHARCYSQALKGLQSVVVGNSPINGIMGTVVAALALIMALIVLTFFPPGRWMGLVMLLVPAIRLYSWLSLEQHIPLGGEDSTGESRR